MLLKYEELRGRVAAPLEKSSSPLSSSESNALGSWENFRLFGEEAAEESKGESLTRLAAMTRREQVVCWGGEGRGGGGDR